MQYFIQEKKLASFSTRNESMNQKCLIANTVALKVTERILLISITIDLIYLKQAQQNQHSDQLPGAVQSEKKNIAETSHDVAVETTFTIDDKASVNNSDNINTGNVNTGTDTSICLIGEKTTTAQEVATTNHFQCKICKRTFKHRYRLKTHERRTYGPKDFNCSHCGFKSNDKVTVQKHCKRLNYFNESIKFDDLFQSERHTENINALDASANVESDVYTDAKVSVTEDNVTKIINLLERLRLLQCKICGFIFLDQG